MDAVTEIITRDRARFNGGTMSGLFVVNVGMLFFTDIPVRLAAGTEVVGLGAGR